MCGIAGFIQKQPDPVAVARVSAAIAHRGPEDEGIWQGVSGPLRLHLIHRRLRVLDLSAAGSQPMVRGALVLVFNGEIYNYLELRRLFEEEGYRFESSGDTEVILAAYAKWGIGCLSRLLGMFAFALWDGNRHELLLARDRLGKKPLYYSQNSGFFAFGSEIKAVLAAIGHTPGLDYQALDEYLTYLYVPYPRTIFAGVLQVPPASWMRIHVLDGMTNIESGEYWNPLQAGPLQRGSIGDRKAQLQDLVAESVRCRLTADVPLGVLLSGGLDSSSIAAMVARCSTEPARSFSIGFPRDKNYDEIPYAKMVAEQFGCHHEVLEAEPSCSRFLAQVVWHFDQPFGNPTAILTYILSALTKKSVTVALTGDGGDELFGGYPRYIGAYMSRVPRALPGFIRQGLLPWIASSLSDDTSGRHQFRRLREFLADAGMPLIEMYLRWVGYFSAADKRELYTEDMARETEGLDAGHFLRGLYNDSEGLDPLNRLAYVDTKSFLCCNVLEYADRMSMAHALELRSPFTDHRLAEFCLRLPYNLKFRNGESKWLLRAAMTPFLPSAVLNKRKLGFNPPLGGWLNGELRELPGILLSKERIERRGLFRCDAVAKLFDGAGQKRRDYSLHLWALMILELWFSLYIDGRSVASVQEEIDRAVASRDRLAGSPPISLCVGA